MIKKALSQRFGSTKVVPNLSSIDGRVRWTAKTYGLRYQTQDMSTIDTLSLLLDVVSGPFAHLAKQSEFFYFLTLDPLVLLALGTDGDNPLVDPQTYKLDFLRTLVETPIEEWVEENLANLTLLCLLP